MLGSLRVFGSLERRGAGRRIVCLAAALALTVSAIVTGTTTPAAAAEVCVVSDPTSTPLNVRDWPEGPVIGTLRDGVAVEIMEIAHDSKGRPWARVRPPGATQIYGWVYRRYLNC